MKKYVLVLAAFFFSTACSNYLDVKPEKRVVIPEKLADLQALLDNSSIMNRGTGHLLGEISGDDIYLPKNAWLILTNPHERNAYVWSEEIFEGAPSNDWNYPSLMVFYANIVVEGVNKIIAREGRSQEADNILGSALFYRAFAQYQLAQLFCKTYVESTAANDPGVPLRLESDITIKTRRASVKQTYHQITEDLKQAAELLPPLPLVKTRPSKPAVYGLLSRAYLQKREYNQALKYGILGLQGYNTLLDYNIVNGNLNFPFELYNAEVIFHSNMVGPAALNPARMAVSSDLYKLYGENDLRRTAYFRQDGALIRYKGAYTGSNAFFSGIATSELVLNVAECEARLGNSSEAEKHLAYLQKSRFKVEAGFKSDITQPVLNRILKERRRELAFRGIRWADIKRLNLEKETEIIMERNWENEQYILSPDSPRYIFPIPEAVVSLSGIEQNKR